jgi:hypothetical protein
MNIDDGRQRWDYQMIPMNENGKQKSHALFDCSLSFKYWMFGWLSEDAEA